MGNEIASARFWQFDEKSIFTFGKHKGKSVLQVFEEQPSYIEFCVTSIPKFVLTYGGWNAIYKSNPDFINASGNSMMYFHMVNKNFEFFRIVRHNTHIAAGQSKPVSDFLNTIVYFKADKPVVKATLKVENNEVVNNKGETVSINESYHKLTFNTDQLDPKSENKIEFSVKIIDYKDLAVFRKYKANYSNPGTKNFEILRALSNILVVLVLSMDIKNVRQGESFNDICILPDDADCVLSIVNTQLTKRMIVSERKMSHAEIEATVEEVKQNLIKAEQADRNDPEFEEFWHYHDQAYLDPGYYVEATIPVYEVVNIFEEILENYSLYRAGFPAKNLFSTTSLYEYRNSLQFTLNVNEVDVLTKQWYETNNNLKSYNLRRQRAERNLREYWRSQDDMYDKPDYDRENWQELTDGQNGHWEDWHEPID